MRILLSLTAKELAVLELLVAPPGVVVSKESLMEHCWDERTDPPIDHDRGARRQSASQARAVGTGV